MRRLIYAAEAVLFVLVAFSSRIWAEDSATPILLFGLMCVLMGGLTIASSLGWTAPRLEVTQVSGPVVNVVVTAVTNLAPGELWEHASDLTEFTMDGQPMAMRARPGISSGDVVTAAGVARARFEVLALRDVRGVCIVAPPGRAFDNARLQIVIHVVLLPFLIGFFTCAVMQRRFDLVWSWRKAVHRAADLMQSTAAPAGPANVHGAARGVSGW